MSTALLIEDDAPRRRGWLMTLADLFMLLVGFFVFVQANPALDARAIGDGIRDAFGVRAEVAPMVADIAAIGGFASGSARLTTPQDTALAWARDAVRDPRVTLTVVGATDGTPGDVDPATGSAAILAADRARVAAALLARVVPADRLRIETGRGGRAALLHIGFAGTVPAGNLAP